MERGLTIKQQKILNLLEKLGRRNKFGFVPLKDLVMASQMPYATVCKYLWILKKKKLVETPYRGLWRPKKKSQP